MIPRFRPMSTLSSSAIVAALAVATAPLLYGQENARTRAGSRAKVIEELVQVRSEDGITNGGALFLPANDSAKSVAVIWIHGNGVNFYYPTYVEIARELAAHGYATLTANTRMHDLGTIAGFRGETRIRGGAYWGLPSDQKRDLSAWIDFAGSRGFKRVVLVGHSAGASAVQSYQAQTQDRRVVGIVLASGRFQPGTTVPDSEMLALATRRVAENLGEDLLRYPNRPRPSFVSAATFLDLANMGQELTDFYGVQTPDPPVKRIRCPIFAWFGTNERDIGTEADLNLLQATLKRLKAGPSRVNTVMIQNADHMYAGEEAQIAQTIVTWIESLALPAPHEPVRFR